MGAFSVKKLKQALKDEIVARSRRLPIRSGCVLYEANSGNGAVCNPEAIFRYLISSADLQHLRHVWVLDDFEGNAAFIREFRGDRRVRFVRYQSAQYYVALARSQYLINNSTFPPELSKRAGQTYLNTWHGTPLKKMGYDVDGGGPETRNIIRNFLSADFILSPNHFTTQTMLRDAYRLQGIYRGAVIEEGYPRVDRQFLTAAQRAEVLDRLRASGVRVGAQDRVLLYAPTWKGSSFYQPANDVEELVALVGQLQSRLAGTGWRVLLKMHQRVVDNAKGVPELEGHLVPNDIPANVVLGVTDALVTDYSSIFYDYQATGRPILFYIPDEEAYAGYRGLYQLRENWPGLVVRTAEDLARSVLAIGSGTDDDPAVAFADVLREAQDRYNPHDDGAATARVVDIVFRRREDGYRILRDFETPKSTLLLYAGGLLPNGITSSFLNLVRAIDRDRYDVSVAYPHSGNPEVRRQVEKLPVDVRLMPRIGRFIAPRTWSRIRRRSPFAWGDAPLTRSAQRAFTEEWRRCYGEAQFDAIVDFSGYSPAWAGLLAGGPPSRRAIWQHNDLAAEVGKTVSGRQPHVKSLPQVFALYSRYDAVVSVSPSLARVNSSSLAEYGPPEKFTFARNVIDAARIRAGAEPERLTRETDLVYSGSSPSLVSDIQALVRAYGSAAVQREVGRQAVLDRYLPTATGKTFVTVGRMSPEKNQGRLIRAFGQIHAEHPSARLVMVGSGPLLESLRILASSLGLSDSVVFTGQLENPYPLMTAADCFVLSSDYEGQPMVLLEAMVLGLPIISTRFGSVADAVGPGQGIVVDRNDEALAEGMRLFLGERPAAPHFDPQVYNAIALEEFEAVIGVRADHLSPAADAGEYRLASASQVTAVLSTVSWRGSVCEVAGWCYREASDPKTASLPQLELVSLTDGTRLQWITEAVDTQAPNHAGRTGGIDLSSTGFRARLDLGGAFGRSRHEFQVQLRWVDEHGDVATALTDRDPNGNAWNLGNREIGEVAFDCRWLDGTGLMFVTGVTMHGAEAGKMSGLVVRSIRLNDESQLVLELSGGADVPGAVVELAGPRARLVSDPALVPSAVDGRIEIVVDLTTCSWLGARRAAPSGRYRLMGRSGDGEELPVRGSSTLAESLPLRWLSDLLSVQVRQRDTDVEVLIDAPLTECEIGKYHRKRLGRELTGGTGRELHGVFLESWYGKSFSDNPAGLVGALKRAGVEKPWYAAVADCSVDVPDDVEPVVVGSAAYWRAMGSSRLVVFNTWFPDELRKAEGQVFVQTWHGTPLKKLGVDTAKRRGNEAAAKRLASGSARWDLFVSQNPFATETLTQAYRYEGRVVEGGYPRNDMLTGPTRAQVRDEVRRRLGVEESTRLVLYAPTWREHAKGAVGPLDVPSLSARLGPDTVILARGHSVALRRGENIAGRGVIDVTTYPEPAHLMLAADCLVTDYSSIMFDFSVLRKPLVFYVPDFEKYTDGGRGVYFDLREQAPGPIVGEPAELATAILGVLDSDWEPDGRYEAWVQRYDSWDDGRAGDRLVAAALEMVDPASDD